MQPLPTRLLRVHHALFVAETLPGDELTIAGKMVDDNSYTATLVGQVLKGTTICAMAILEGPEVEASLMEVLEAAVQAGLYRRGVQTSEGID